MNTRNDKPVRILFVCMGNICRSPTAEGVFRRKIEEAGLEHAIEIDSAGTHSYHIGKAPDPRALEAAARRGIDLSSLRARQAKPVDFERFDYILAMDRDNYRELKYLAEQASGKGRLHLFLEFARDRGEEEVPDPYFGGSQGFEHVLDLIEDASEGFIEHLRREHNLQQA